MKKSIEVTVLLALVSFILFFSHGTKLLTGMQAAYDLPEPPPVPGFEEEAPPPVVQQPVAPPVITTNVTTRNVTRNVTRPRIEVPAAVPETFGLESRVAALEKAVAGLQQQFARVDTLESQVQGLNTDAENMRRFMSRPIVDQPAFFEGLAGLKGSITRNAVLSISLSVFVLLLVIGLIATTMIQKRKEGEEEKKLVKQYLQNYSRQGYKLETLKMHLQASGWSEEVINEAMRELQKR